MARRRIRRRTGVWLPNLGTVQPTGTGRENADEGRSIFLTVRGDGGITQLIIPVTFDNPLETDETSVTTETPLDEFLGNEYFLERIVGNCFVQFRQRDNTQAGEVSPGGAIATAAFFVARADGTLIDSDQPIGATVSTQAELSSYSPQNDVNIREPWIWRRTWLVGNLFQPALSTQNGQFTVTLPPSNSHIQGGGSMSGPHIDAHTKRNVGQDDRLWFVASVRSYPLNEQSDANQNLDSVLFYLDYRLFGHIRKAQGTGKF